jgi:hypothetical protein
MAMTDEVAGIVNWTGRGEWADLAREIANDHIIPACEDFEVTRGQLSGILPRSLLDLLGEAAYYDFLTRRFEPNGLNVIDDYLKRRGYKESPGNRRYLAAVRDSVLSLYEIIDVIPGESLLLRDLFRGGDPVRVTERAGSLANKAGDRLAGRVVQQGSKTVLSGGLLRFGPGGADELLKELVGARNAAAASSGLATLLDRVVDDEDASQTDLRILSAAAPMFSNVWLEELLAEALGREANRGDDEDASDDSGIHVVSFPFKSRTTVEAVRERMSGLVGFREDEPEYWLWTDPKKDDTSPSEEPAELFGISLDLQGYVEIIDRALILSAETKALADEGAAILSTALGTLVGDPEITVEDFDDDLFDSDEAEADAAAPDESISRETLHAAMTALWRDQLDNPIKALGNLSPRAAAKTSSGRPMVVVWLRAFEEGSTKGEMADLLEGYDFTWMWKELGIEKLR